MSNVKVQSSNESQNPKDQEYFDIKAFVIDLTFRFLNLSGTGFDIWIYR
jgi:hypothetical protein